MPTQCFCRSAVLMMFMLTGLSDAGLCSTGSSSAPSPASAPNGPSEPPKLFEQYCFDCHGHGADEGNLALDELLAKSDQKKSDQHLAKGDAEDSAHQHWVAIWKNLRAQTMPPADADQPMLEDRQAAIAWIEREVFQLDPDHPDPGRVTIRRLNREEYHNTIRDLLGIRFDANDEFPADDTGYGFDTIGDVLSISPLLLEKYLQAAEQIVDQMLRNDSTRRRWLAEPIPQSAPQREKYLRGVLKRFTIRAFRRPVDDVTVDRLWQLTQHIAEQPQSSWEQGLSAAFAAVLSSPRFLFRAEHQADPNDPGQVVSLDEYALASRLSYFLWSSSPDDELLELAAQGKLRQQLTKQIDRMLRDDRSERFIENFVGQWLQVRDVETKNMDARRVLGLRSSRDANRIFSYHVRRAMRRETEMMFQHVIQENRSLLELLDGRYTFVNEPLAEFYGIDGVKGREMRRVDLAKDSHRRGLLTHGSFLVVTSNPTRTSPVKRGLFILENVLGTPSPPPPPDVPELEESRRAGKKLTMREALELHRQQPLCASCHRRMDPLGLALENYNALGQFRSDEDGKPIEAGGQLMTGESFETVEQLAKVLATDRRHDFYRCLTEKLLTYALGRGVEYYDAPTVDQIVTRVEKKKGSARELILAVIESVPFQKRRGDDASP